MPKTDRLALKAVTADRIAEVMQFMGYSDVASFAKAMAASKPTVYKWLEAGSAPTPRLLQKHFDIAKTSGHKEIKDVPQLVRYVRGGFRPTWFRVAPPPNDPAGSGEALDESGAAIIEFQAPDDHADRVSASALYDAPVADPELLLAAVSCARRISPRALVMGGEMQELTTLVLQAAETMVLPGDSVSAINNKKYMKLSTCAGGCDCNEAELPAA